MRVLDFLPQGENVSGEHLAKTLKITRAAVHKQIQALRSKGYVIDSHKNVGYRLASMPDMLFPEMIVKYAEGGKDAYEIFHSDAIDSTQNRAKFFADRAAREWTVVIAEKQTAARGRLNREWIAPQGGIWLSIVLRPSLIPSKVPQVMLLASLSLTNAIRKTYPELTTGIKWPNDVMVNGKKVAGILAEMSAEVDNVNWVVLGIGINANNELPSFLRESAISLKQAVDKEVNRPALTAVFLDQFRKDYGKYLKGGFDGFMTAYDRLSVIKNKKVTVYTPEGNIEGKVQKIGKDGYLWVKTRDGKIAKILAGDVSLSGES